MARNDICDVTRKSIYDKIDNLEDKLKLSIKNINDRIELQLQAHKNLISESTKNTNVILDDQYNDINVLIKKMDNMNNVISDIDHLSEKLLSMKQNIVDLEKYIDLLNTLDKNMSKTTYDLKHIENDIEHIKNDIDELENELSQLNDIFNSNDYRTIPNMVIMYDRIMKYKYIIIGGLFVILLFIDGGTSSTMGTLIMKMLSYFGI
jgi:chromosome segregation ATPase